MKCSNLRVPLPPIAEQLVIVAILTEKLPDLTHLIAAAEPQSRSFKNAAPPSSPPPSLARSTSAAWLPKGRSRMSLHKEISFEDEICEHLAAHDWLYEAGAAPSTIAPGALFPPDVVAWIAATQPKAWETLTQKHGAAAEGVLLDRVRKQLDDRGTLDVLRHGVDIIGLKAHLRSPNSSPRSA